MHIYNNILEDKFAKNIESEVLHLPFYLNHHSLKTFNEMQVSSPFLISAKHPTDTVDMAQEISGYVINHFMNKIILKNYKVQNASLCLFLDGIGQQVINQSIYKYSMIYFVNSTQASVYINGKKIISGISESDTIFVNNNDSIVSLDTSGIQCIIVANMEDLDE